MSNKHESEKSINRLKMRNLTHVFFVQDFRNLNYSYYYYLLNFAHTYTYIFLLLKSRLIKIRARDLLETIKHF